MVAVTSTTSTTDAYQHPSRTEHDSICVVDGLSILEITVTFPVCFSTNMKLDTIFGLNINVYYSTGTSVSDITCYMLKHTA
jgi:hypothetical protein